MCGNTLGVVCQICIALYMFGTTIAFLVIIGDQLVDGKSCILYTQNFLRDLYTVTAIFFTNFTKNLVFRENIIVNILNTSYFLL